MRIENDQEIVPRTKKYKGEKVQWTEKGKKKYKGRKSFFAMDITCVLLDRHYQYVMFLKITVVENLTELGPLLKLYQIGMKVSFFEKGSIV